MRINKFLAQGTGLSRRAADRVIAAKQVTVDGQIAELGSEVKAGSIVKLNGETVQATPEQVVLILNKPAGYVCSRNGQGSQTIYDLLPAEYHRLKPVGRLDKDSSGLILLTNNGDLAQSLAHPSYAKVKLYEVSLNRQISESDQAKISQDGVLLDDGLSKLGLSPLRDRQAWQVSMSEGRNRQIRRTFEALGYRVDALHRTTFGDYQLGDLASGQFRIGTVR